MRRVLQNKVVILFDLSKILSVYKIHVDSNY